MKELIKVTTTEEGKELVSARDLYEFLEATERFNSWFERYCKYGFEKNVDFTSVKSFTVVNNGARKEIDDYAMTIDMAKEFSMLQKTEKGKEARRYFIKRDEILKEVQEELKKIELSNEDKITKLLSAIPECDRTAAMFKLVDRFYPENNNVQPIPEAKDDTNKYDKTVLTDEFLIQVIKEHYNDLYIRDITHKGVDCITIYKKKLIKIFEDMGITKKELFRFLRTKNYIFYAQVRHGYVPKNHWEYFIEKDFFNK